MKVVCETCDTPAMCLSGLCPCSLCGEFIAPFIPINAAKKKFSRPLDYPDKMSDIGMVKRASGPPDTGE